jgi:hypothetical protein
MTAGCSTADLVAAHVKRVARGDVDERGAEANRILERIHRGDGVDVLAPLFECDEVDCAKSLVFVLSEIGARSIEAMPWIDRLLDHRDEYVRHYAVVALQHSGSLSHGEVTAKAIAKVDDTRSVALAALKLLALGSLSQIATAVEHLDGDLGDSVRWLVGGSYEQTPPYLADDNGVALVGVAAAYRLRHRDPGALARLVDDRRLRVADAARYIARFEPLPPEGRDILHRIAGATDDGSPEQGPVGWG